MLLGEYAVLHGKHAVVCAVDKRIQVQLTARHDNTISISSSLGMTQFQLNAINIAEPFQFVASVFKHFKSLMSYGCDIEIQSDFSEKIGFGSSAAVTVAMMACMNQ